MNAGYWAVPAAFLISLSLTPLVRRYALSRGLLDAPGPRRSHDRRVARGGGLAVVGALLVVILMVNLEPAERLLVGTTIAGVGLLGWFEDHRPMPVGVRLGLQFGFAVLAVLALGPVTSISIAGHSVPFTVLWSSMAVIAMVWLTNLYNFMDGSDGLASAQAALSGLLFGWGFGAAGEMSLSVLALCISAASLGFLAWNRPPARVFLGDSGSLTLGWMIAVLALAGTLTGAISVWLAFIIASVFTVDATATLVDRLVRGRGWYTPHRDHAYQRLIRRGWSHARVLTIYFLVNVLVVAPATAVVLAQPDRDLTVAVIVGVVLLAGWTIIRCCELAEQN